MLDLHAKLITKCHLADCLCQSMSLYRISGKDASCLDIGIQLLIAIHDLRVIRQVILVFLNIEYNDLAARLLKLRCDDVRIMVYIHCEGNQGRRNVDLAVFLVVKGTGHTVLTADRWKSKAKLCVVSTKQGCKRCAPAGRILGHALKVLLEGKTDLLKVTATCHDLCNGRQHSVDSTVVRAPAGQIWVIAVAHHGHGIGPAFQDRKFRYHGLGFGQLVFTAIRHEDTASADRTIKTLYQTLLGTYI